MGSFIDCAYLDIFGVLRPTATTKVERAKQWESAHLESIRWKREFWDATIKLGEALLIWCSSNDEIDEIEQAMIQKWIDVFKEFSLMPDLPINIEVLEHNLRFHDQYYTKSEEETQQ